MERNTKLELQVMKILILFYLGKSYIIILLKEIYLASLKLHICKFENIEFSIAKNKGKISQKSNKC